MAKGNQKAHARVVEEVLGEISQERRAAYADALKRARLLREHVASVDADPEAQRVVREAADAETDLKAHSRYEGKVDAQAYGAEKSRLEAANGAAQAALRVLQKREQERVAPIEEAFKAAQQRAQSLDREWNGHLRMAKAAGVNLKPYWTPESGEPAEVPTAAVAA